MLFFEDYLCCTRAVKPRSWGLRDESECCKASEDALIITASAATITVRNFETGHQSQNIGERAACKGKGAKRGNLEALLSMDPGGSHHSPLAKNISGRPIYYHIYGSGALNQSDRILIQRSNSSDGLAEHHPTGVPMTYSGNQRCSWREIRQATMQKASGSTVTHPCSRRGKWVGYDWGEIGAIECEERSSKF